MRSTTKALRTLSYKKLSASRCLKGQIDNLCIALFSVFLTFPLWAWSQSLPVYQQADSQFELKQFDSAVVAFNQFIDSFPHKKEGYFNRGLCYYRMNKLAEARRDFNSCLQIDSVFNDAIFMETLILQKEGHWTESNIEIKKLNTSYAGYNELKKSIRYHNLSVILSRNWYYMIAIMFLFIILVGVVAKSYAVRRGY